MTRKQRPPRPSTDREPVSFRPLSLDFLGSLGLCLAAATVVGRMAFPSEDAVNGSGVLFILLSLLSSCFLAAGLFARNVRPPTSWALLWSLLIGWIWISSLQADYRFGATLLAWEWTAIGLSVILLSAYAGLKGPRGFVQIVSLLLVWQATVALWQVAVEFPEMRRQFETADPQFLAEMAAIGVIPGSVEERLFRDRLFAGEPYGTFAHPNSLAGLFVLGLPAFIAWLWSAAQPRRLRLLGPGAAAFVVGAALLLTKSRSALLAAPMGFLTWWGMEAWFSGRWRLPRYLLWGAAGGVLLISALAWGGYLDLLVLTESLKSLSYRLEWWKGSAHVFAEAPLWGVGFGNFGSRYLAYKLPFSSEEITDPHNFLIELACSAGLPAAILYLALVGVTFFLVLRDVSTATPEHSRSYWASAGLLFGGLLAFFLTPMQTPGAIGLFVMLAALTVSWVVGGRPEGSRSLRLAILGGVLALHVHWLAAGGVAYPSLLGCCWFLVVGALPSSTQLTRPQSLVFAGPLTGITVLAVAIFASSIYGPIQRRDQILLGIRSNGQRGASEILRSAAEAVPGDLLGWLRLAQWHQDRLMQGNGTAEDYGIAEESLRIAVSLEPARSSNYVRLAGLYEVAAKRELDADAPAKRISAWEAALERYPNLAKRRYEYGRALLEMGREDEAKVQFEIALDLDRTPHPIKNWRTRSGGEPSRSPTRLPASELLLI